MGVVRGRSEGVGGVKGVEGVCGRGVVNGRELCVCGSG